MESWWQDLRYAIRGMRNNPSVAVLSVLSMGLAFAGNLCVFGMINGVMFRPMPFEDPDRLIFIGEEPEGERASSVPGVSMANFLDWQERQTSFESLTPFRSQPMNLSTGDRARLLNSAAVGPGFFRVLGASVDRGRLLVEEEGLPGRDRVALVSSRFWSLEFGPDTELDGQTLSLGGKTFEIVGVLAPSFEFFDPTIEVWAALALDPTRASRIRRDIYAVGRLKAGVAEADALAEMRHISATLAQEHPDINRGLMLRFVNLRNDIPDPRNRRQIGLLLMAMFFVMLIAGVNVASLLVARSQVRRREMAIRSALGAPRKRIAKQLFTESLVMAAASAAVGFVIGYVLIRGIRAVLANSLAWYMQPTIDQRVLLFSLGLMLLVSLLFGIAPMSQTLKWDLTSALRVGGVGGPGSGGRRRGTQTLVVVEIALALVCLGTAAMLVDGFVGLEQRDPLFDDQNLILFQLALPEASYPTDQARAEVSELLIQRMAALPGVDHAAVASSYPRASRVAADGTYASDSPPRDGELPKRANWMAVSPSFFGTLGIELLEGRAFSAEDHPTAEPVVVVNHSLADRLWPGEPAVGKRVVFQDRERRVVGVVADVRHALLSPDSELGALYLPWAQAPLRQLSFTLRSRLGDTALLTPLRRSIREVDPDLALSRIQDQNSALGKFFQPLQIFSVLLGAFGALALFLAALGTYGILSYLVVIRIPEIGIRMALGADRKRVVKDVMSQGIVLAAGGLALGVPGVWASTKLVQSAMADPGTVAPSTVLIVAGILVMISLLASWLPAQRAGKLDPVEGLRKN